MLNGIYICVVCIFVQCTVCVERVCRCRRKTRCERRWRSKRGGLLASCPSSRRRWWIILTVAFEWEIGRGIMVHCICRWHDRCCLCNILFVFSPLKRRCSIEKWCKIHYVYKRATVCIYCCQCSYAKGEVSMRLTLRTNTRKKEKKRKKKVWLRWNFMGIMLIYVTLTPVLWVGPSPVLSHLCFSWWLYNRKTFMLHAIGTASRVIFCGSVCFMALLDFTEFM